ncbi:WRKY transcription factor 23-like [Euphorbia lathyris]|uniref:WRKY transcription factor 23-like n=1 Tax=Euphorbia lathyris TaxID=212925 RepID=UPI003313A06C
MEAKEPLKIENHILGSSTFPALFDNMCEEYQDRNSLGFMELLGMHDFGASMFDVLEVPSSSITNPLFTKMESSSSEVFNQPATPNSSSVSSASSEALNDDQQVKLSDIEEEDEEQQQKTKKELKTKKTNQKRQREPRFAFMTKSEVDHLEDGYRWRKYGQKAVKNSPFPRSYYRCTTSSCNVKKRVERSFNDPTIVVTTYEGQHTHPSPVMPRPSFIGAVSDSDSYTQRRLSSLYQHHQQQHQQQQQQTSPFLNSFSPNLGYGNSYINNGSTVISTFLHHEHQKRYCTTPTRSALLEEDHGLLQDVVPSHMLKEE